MGKSKSVFFRAREGLPRSGPGRYGERDVHPTIQLPFDTENRALPERFAAIAGAPRCGTTSLSTFLAGHPEVCFSSVKEPHFFALNDLSTLDTASLRRRVIEDYVPRFFAGCVPRQALWAEGSVSFLYTPEAAHQLLRVWPAAQFVIALRDPIEMLPSLHERYLYQGDETIEEFGRAWRMTMRRARGEAIPRTCLDPRLLRYDIAARYALHLERFFEAVGRERCLVILHEDILNRPAEVIGGLYRFLELPDDGRRRLPRARSGRRYRIGALQRLLKRPPQPLYSLLAGRNHRRRMTTVRSQSGFPKWTTDVTIRLRRRLLKLNSVPSQRPPLSPELRREIRETFASDVRLLGDLIGRDLSHWLAPELTEAPATSTPARPRAAATG